MTSVSAATRSAKVGRNVIDRFKELVRSGGLAHAAEVDRGSGEILDADSRALFAGLPTVSPATLPEELVEHGLIDRLPAGLRKAMDRPKYRVGREVFVQATVSHAGRGPVGRYDRVGSKTFTHRGVLRGLRNNDLLVELEGARDLLRFSPTDLFTWNEPAGVQASGGTLSGVQIDYNDPLMKAHICAGLIDIAPELAQLNFDTPDADTHQARLVHRVASRVRMSYPGRGDGYAGSRAGSLLHGGMGVCFVQRAVATGYLQAFARTLAMEVQSVVGRTLRLDVPHGFAVVTLRPSLQRFACDPAWSEPLTELRLACFDAGWGHDRRIEGFEGHQDLTVRPNDVELPELTEQPQ